MLLLSAPLVLATPLGLASEDLQPANKSSTYWACPEYGLNFWSVGNDITHYENINSWQECGKLASTIHGPHTPIQAVSAMHTRPAATGVGLFPGARGAPMPRGAGSTTQMAE